jgi:hypothetical protein
VVNTLAGKAIKINAVKRGKAIQRAKRFKERQQGPIDKKQEAMLKSF